MPSPSAPRELPNAVKQLLSFELGREIMRRSRRGGDGGGSAGASSAAAAGAGAKAAPPASKTGPKIVTQREPSERKDMFGRVVTAAPARKRKDAPSGGGSGGTSAAEPETVQQVGRTPPSSRPPRPARNPYPLPLPQRLSPTLPPQPEPSGALHGTGAL